MFGEIPQRPKFCRVYPRNLSEVDATYTLTIDTEEYSTKGVLVAKCGLFEESEQSISVDLPLPPEPIGDADRQVLDDIDACGHPAGEPRVLNGIETMMTTAWSILTICARTPQPVLAWMATDVRQRTRIPMDSQTTLMPAQAHLLGASRCFRLLKGIAKGRRQRWRSNDIDTCPNTPSGEPSTKWVFGKPNWTARPTEDSRSPRRRTNCQRSSQHARDAGHDGKLSDYEFVLLAL